jgi:hypothetical protein
MDTSGHTAAWHQASVACLQTLKGEREREREREIYIYLGIISILLLLLLPTAHAAADGYFFRIETTRVSQFRPDNSILSTYLKS